MLFFNYKHLASLLTTLLLAWQMCNGQESVYSATMQTVTDLQQQDTNCLYPIIPDSTIRQLIDDFLSEYMVIQTDSIHKMSDLSMAQYDVPPMVNEGIPATIASPRDNDNDLLARTYQPWLGVTYRTGGTSHKGFDCSGFTMKVVKRVYDINLPHSSRAQYFESCACSISKSELKRGDLVFFVTNGRKPVVENINHVGIYIGNNKFVHASVLAGVIISDLSEPYYKRNWVTGGRMKPVQKRTAK